MLEKPERRLVLRIMDAQSLVAEEHSINNFISGVELAWQLSMKLKRSFHARKGGSIVKKRIINTIQ